MMRLRATHLLFRDADAAPDVLARQPDGGRVFVPGVLPCGECPRCRRGLVAACPRRRRAFPDPSVEVELDGRYLASVDEPPGAAPIEDTVAVTAGVVAQLLEAIARAGVGPEQLAVWIGDDPRAAVGVRLCARLGAVSVAAPPDETGRAALETATETAPGGFRERRLFAIGDQPRTLAALLQPGTTLSLLDSPGTWLSVADLALCRVLVAGSDYHPDFVPEALAALRGDPGLLAGTVVAGNAPQARSLVLITL
jgi:hypothetical protein